MHKNVLAPQEESLPPCKLICLFFSLNTNVSWHQVDDHRTSNGFNDFEKNKKNEINKNKQLENTVLRNTI